MSVTVQVLEALGPRLVGLQARVVTKTGVKVMVTFFELLPRVAVTVADWLFAIAPVVTAKVAEVDAAGTVTDAGTVSVVLVFVSVTRLPPVGAA